MGTEGMSSWNDYLSSDKVATEYVNQMSAIASLGLALDSMDFEWLSATLAQAHSLGPLLFPDAYLVSSLDDQERVVRAARAFRDEVKRAVSRVEEVEE